MHVAVWLLTGLAAGWLARILLRGRARLGVLGDLIVGTLGGALGGRLLRVATAVPEDAFGAHALAALCGALVVFAAAQLAGRALARSFPPGPPATSAARAAAGDFDAQVRRLGAWERHVLGHLLRRERVVRDVSAEFEETLTFGQRVADRVASFGGSWTFIGVFFILIVIWMLLNTETRARWDIYPFILLNLILSCLAALQAPVIMMSQNRLAHSDRAQAAADYEINLKAELEIMAIGARLDAFREEQARMLALQESLVRRIDELRSRLEGSSPVE